MSRIVTISISLLLIFTFCGCATIATGGGGQQRILFNSEPPEAKITITDRDGKVISENAKTPRDIGLDRGAGYFRYGKYNVLFEKDGYEKKQVSIEGNANGWYAAGNLFWGLTGLLGYLVIDPATGAMWTIRPDRVNVSLVAKGMPEPLAFNKEEFTAPLSADRLCSAIDSDRYDIKFTSAEKSIPRLNEMLERPDLYDKLAEKGKLPKAGSGEVQLPPEIDNLKNQTASYRLAYTEFYGLTLEQQSNLKKFNRKLLEISYPNETPRIK